METETQTMVLRDHDAERGVHVLEVGRVERVGAFGPPVLLLTTRQLQQVVQAAADQHGIVPTGTAPSVIDPWRPCGRPQCSDAAVRP